MRVVFAGTSGAGKTTVLNALLDKALTGELSFPLPHRLYSATHEVYTRNGIYKEENVLSTSQHVLKNIQFELFKERVAIEQDNKNFISDRSIIDYYIWTLMRCSGVLAYEDVQWLKKEMLERVKCYDLIVNFESPLNFYEMKDDYRLRAYGQEYVYRQLFDNVLKWNSIQCAYLTWCDLDERVKLVEENIYKIYKNVKEV